MNSDYLKYAHSHLQSIDDGVPVYQQGGHVDMAKTLALMSIADSLIKLLDIFKQSSDLIQEQVTGHSGMEDDEAGWDIMKPGGG